MSGNEANCKYKVEGATSGFLQRCFPNPTQCKNNGFPYYNNAYCWAKCPNKYAIENLQLKAFGNTYTCDSGCSAGYPKYSTGAKICKSNCDKGEYLDPTNNQCVSSCGGFVGDNNECISTCPYGSYTFIINAGGDNQKKKCVSSCVRYGKYYNYGNNNCINACSDGQFVNSVNQCLSTCSDANNAQLSTECYDYVNPGLSVYPCLTSGEITNLYYYNEAPKRVYATCDIFDKSGTRLICSYCADTSGKYVYNNYCVTECPYEAPYFRKQSKPCFQSERST